MTICTLPYRSQLAAGKPEDIGMVLADLDTIAGVINGNLTNVNFNAAAAIAWSKMFVSGTPDGTKFLKDNYEWGALPSGSGITKLMKTTTKDITGTSKTDLLNDEITILANTLKTTSVLRMFLGGDYQNNSAGNRTMALSLEVGGVEAWNTGQGDNIGNNATRRAWWLDATISPFDSTHIATDVRFSLGTTTAATTGTGGLATPIFPLIPITQNSSGVTLTSDQTLKVFFTSSGSNTSMRLLRGMILIFDGT